MSEANKTAINWFSTSGLRLNVEGKLGTCKEARSTAASNFYKTKTRTRRTSKGIAACVLVLLLFFAE